MILAAGRAEFETALAHDRRVEQIESSRRDEVADLEAARKTVDALIRDIPDYPQQGIVFKDLTPVLAAPEALEQGV